MSGKTIGKTLNNGFAGNFARMPDMVIGTLPVEEDSEKLNFGDAVFLEDGCGTSYQTGMTAADFVGVAVSEIKSAFTYGNMDGAYAPGQAASVLKRGAVSVLCNVGNPVIGKPVFVRIANNAGIPSAKIGGFEAAADGANTVQLTNAVWSSGKDVNSVAELLLRAINLV